MTESTLKAALAHYGPERQMAKMTEECAELIVALHHFAGSKIRKESVIEEIADVLIMANQMRLLFGPAQVDAAIAYKVERLGKRVAA